MCPILYIILHTFVHWDDHRYNTGEKNRGKGKYMPAVYVKGTMPGTFPWLSSGTTKKHSPNYKEESCLSIFSIVVIHKLEKSLAGSG